jgi:hypothetical protein
VDCPGLFSVTVKVFFAVTHTLPECVSRQPHCSNIRVSGAQRLEQTTTLVTNGWCSGINGAAGAQYDCF